MTAQQAPAANPAMGALPDIGRQRRGVAEVRRSAFMRLNMAALLSLGLTVWPTSVRSTETRRQSVSVDFIPKEPSLVISEQGASITVQIPVISRPQAALGTVDSRPAPDVAKFGLQVWLLRTDGTVVPQQVRNGVARWIASMGTEQWFVMFSFEMVPLADITGIVFLKEGKLYSHSIAATDWRQM